MTRVITPTGRFAEEKIAGPPVGRRGKPIPGATGPRMSAAPIRLLGRDRERELLAELVAAIRGGESRSLVVMGEAGIGKTALLQYLTVSASDLTVLQAAGVESEIEWAYAGLHQLCRPMLDRLQRLPTPQRRALEIVFGLSAGAAPDRFFVGLAVLSLFSDTAAEHPLLCVIDDAQWLDHASALTLAFVARRLLAESVGLVFAARETAEERSGLPELFLHGLGNADARELLALSIGGRVDERVREQIVAEARGNPLALLELPRGSSRAQFAGGYGVPDLLPLPDAIVASFMRRVKQLPSDTRLLLLIAAAEPIGDPELMWRAAARLSIARCALDPAVETALVDVDVRVRFRHPLVRSALYRAASSLERQSVHKALAEATDAAADPDRCVWHRAQAASDVDEEVAAELEYSAGRALLRGGLAAAAAFLERASKLTPEPARRAHRALAAAEFRLQTGAHDATLDLLAQVESGPLDELQRAQVHSIRGQVAFASRHGRDAPPLLLAAARELEPVAPELARDAYLDALSAGMFVGRLGGDVGLLEVARAARGLTASSARPQDLLLVGLAVVITEGHAAGAPLLKRAVNAFRTEPLEPAEAIRWLWLAAHAAHDLWDDQGWEHLSSQHVRLARDAGALTVLPLALASRIGLHLFAGELSRAKLLVDEFGTVIEATRCGLPRYDALALAAFRGREAETETLAAGIVAELPSRGEGMGLTLVAHSSAVLYNGLGRYREACDAAERGAANPPELAFSMWSLPQLIEAAIRSGRTALAHEAMQQLAQATRPSGTDWALGIEARSRALLHEGDGPEALYREAIERLAGTRVHAELARAHLLFGEWLRRSGPRHAARDELRTAHTMFSDMGMEAFAERARRELGATGERVRRRTVETRDDLTSQERQIAQLARNGLSNMEIGTRLFLSPRTVEWHLGKVFQKLGISRRRDLSNAFPDDHSELCSA
jgi:DNA-binding CsgD family transcriptional regulator